MIKFVSESLEEYESTEETEKELEEADEKKVDPDKIIPSIPLGP